MALSRTASLTASAVAGTAVLVALAGCGPVSLRQLDFTDTETVAVTTVTIRGGAGTVVVRSGGAGPDVQIRRTVRYKGTEPTTRHRVEGTELVLDTDCGRRCTVSYEVATPRPVAVRGENGSGDLRLDRVGAVQVKLGSGNVTVSSPAGPVRVETGSGDVQVDNAAAEVSMHTGSGNVTGRAIGGTVEAETGSGNVSVELGAPASARVHAGSGNVHLTVPSGAYRVQSDSASGEVDLQVTDDPTARFLLDLETGSGNIVLRQR